MRSKDTYYIKVWDEACPESYGIGEAALFRGLSADDRPGYEEKLSEVCRNIDRFAADPALLDDWSSIRMGLETALSDLHNGGLRTPFANQLDPIRINGLIWMGDLQTMKERVDRKLSEGFSCIKMKIGGIDEEDEISLLRYLRQRAPEVEIRLDANGAFTPSDALRRLQRLAEFGVHSIEQPIKAGQIDEMARLCACSPIPIALDEELIGIPADGRRELLERIRPAYIVIKPTLCGGFGGTDQWIAEAERLGIGWWVTSALESDIGLNAIALYVSCYRPVLPQGLGTGELYSNNIPSPLRRAGEWLGCDPSEEWLIPPMKWNVS